MYDVMDNLISNAWTTILADQDNTSKGYKFFSAALLGTEAPGIIQPSCFNTKPEAQSHRLLRAFGRQPGAVALRQG